MMRATIELGFLLLAFAVAASAEPRRWEFPADLRHADWTQEGPGGRSKSAQDFPLWRRASRSSQRW